MPRQVIARVLLVCAMLLAQQTALAHDLWHATPHAQKAGKSGKLCELHDLMGTVLGAVSAAVPQTHLLPLSEVAFFDTGSRAAENRPLVPQSRGPPIRS